MLLNTRNASANGTVAQEVPPLEPRPFPMLQNRVDVLVFNALFDSGKANARSADNKGWTPLMIASKFGLNEQVEKLLTYREILNDFHQNHSEK